MRHGKGIVHPVLDAQSGDAPEFLRIVGHPHGAKVQYMSGDQRASRLAGGRTSSAVRARGLVSFAEHLLQMAATDWAH